jgi:hypothetical protein
MPLEYHPTREIASQPHQQTGVFAPLFPTDLIYKIYYGMLIYVNSAKKNIKDFEG